MLKRFDRTLDVSLYDHVEVLDFTLLDLRIERFEGNLLHVSAFTQALKFLTLGANLPGLALILGNLERISRSGDIGKTDDLHRGGGTGFFDLFPGIIEHRPYAAGINTRNVIVSLTEGSPFDEHGGDDSSTLIDP